MSILQKYLLSSVVRDAAGEGAAAGAGAAAAGAGTAAEAAKGAENKGAGGGAEKPFWDGALDATKDKDVIDYIGSKKYDGFATALRSGMSAEKSLRDRNTIPLPEKGKEREWEGWEKFGWVKELDKYQLSAIDETTLPKGFKIDQGRREAMRALAHENRIPLSVADGIMQKMLAADIEAHNARVTETEGKQAEMDKALRAKWGPDFDRNGIFAKRAAQALGEQAGLDIETLGKLGNAMGDVGLMSFFHFLGTQIGEDKIGAFNAGGSAGVGESVAELDAEVNRLMSDPNWRAIFDNPRHQLHQAHVDQRNRLLERKARAAGAKG